jgi:FkbH-like protein
MEVGEFLFPRDLERTPLALSRVLVIGSCLAEAYVHRFREQRPETTFDFVLYNNAVELPGKSAEEIRGYDFQYVQLPLRSVLSERAIRVADVGEESLDLLAIGRANIDAMLSKALRYNREAGLLSLVSNFIVPQSHVAPSLMEVGGEEDIAGVARALNAYLVECITGLENVFLVDTEALAASLGKRYFLDDTVVFTTHGAILYDDWHHHEAFPPWTAPAPGRIEPIPDLAVTYEIRYREFFRAALRQLEALVRVVRQVDPVKLVVFDLDNTLWRGQLVDHYQPGERWPYTDGWPLGLWEAVQQLRRRGILVSIASKNDRAVVEERWSQVVDPPFLKFSDFVAPQIGWHSKVDSIARLMETFSLTPKSVVFVDDNPVEREAMRLAYPDIRTLGADPFVVRRVLLWAPETQLARRTRETARRESMMRRQVEREEARAAVPREEFLASLALSVELAFFASASHPSFSRAFELVNKTNQFNTNGGRWSHESMLAFFEAGGAFATFTVRDRFADYGLVGVVIFRGAQIVQLVMSCRVIGLDVEVAALERVVREMRARTPGEPLAASIVETSSNTPCRDVFLRAGFTPLAGGAFELPLSREPVPALHVGVVTS